MPLQIDNIVTEQTLTVQSLVVTQSSSINISTVAVNTTLDSTYYHVNVNASSGAIQISLPAVSGISGRMYVIKKTDNTANAVTVKANGAETIDGSNTKVITTQYDSVTLITDGTSWHIETIVPSRTVGTSGTDVNFSLSGTQYSLNIPDASNTARGVLTTGTQTIAGTKTFSSTITGSVTGNAGTATALQTARTINGTSFDGTANITVTAAAGTLTGTTLNSTVVSSSLTSVGTITTGVWTGTAIAAANGGTGQTTYAIGDLLYASTTSALSKLAAVAAGSYLRSAGTGTAPVWSTTTLPNSATTGDILYASASNVYSNLAGVATGNALISGGVGVAPSWGKIGLTTHVSGTLAVGNGGTGQTSYTNGQLLIGNTTGNTLTVATLTAGYGSSVTNGAGSITLATSLTSTDTASTTTNTTTSTTYALLTNSISGTPAAGTYLVTFSCSMGANTTTAASTFISLYTGVSGSTTQVAGTERRLTNGSGGQGGTVTGSASFQKTITFNGTDIYEIRWRVSGGTSSIFSRVFTLTRIA